MKLAGGGRKAERPGRDGDHRLGTAIDVCCREVQQRPPVLGEPVVPAPILAELLRGEVRDLPVELRADPLVAPAGVQVAPALTGADPNLEVGSRQATVDEPPSHP
jgi:hypothetical protein